MGLDGSPCDLRGLQDIVGEGNAGRWDIEKQRA